MHLAPCVTSKGKIHTAGKNMDSKDRLSGFKSQTSHILAINITFGKQFDLCVYKVRALKVSVSWHCSEDKMHI